jgi:hypothetical protein
MPQGKNLLKKAMTGYFFIVLFGVWPIVIAVASGLLALLFGGSGHEGGNVPEPRIFGLHHVGHFFDILGNIGWLSLLTFPVAAIAFIVFTVYLVFLFIKNRCTTRP